MTNGFLRGGKGYALTAIDVLTTEANGAVVAFGSSTFQGYESDYDADDRVADLLANRIESEIPAGRRKGVVDEGVGSDSLYVGLAQNAVVVTPRAVRGDALRRAGDRVCRTSSVPRTRDARARGRLAFQAPGRRSASIV